MSKTALKQSVQYSQNAQGIYKYAELSSD